MVEMSGARAFVKALEKEGVDHVFGVPGGSVIPICDELLDSNIRFVLGRHEQGAAHMADGFARSSGRVGVCLATSGPGATNLVTGLATANIDSSPVVAFTGQVNLNQIGTDAFQEVDIIGVSASVTKYNMQVRRPSEIPYSVKAAFKIASTGRKGSVLVDLPKDTTIEIEDVTFPEKVTFRGYNVHLEPDSRELDWASTLLAKAKKPIIMAGGGVLASNATHELIELAEFLMAPTTTTLMGKGAFPQNHPLSLGLCGMHGTFEANNLVPEADVLLVVGSRFSDRTTGELSAFSPNARIIHMDIDRSEVDKNVETVTRVIGDAKIALQGLLYRLRKNREVNDRENQWHAKIKEFKQFSESVVSEANPFFKASSAIKVLREALPRDAIVATEVGQCQMWAALHYDVYEPGTFFTSGGLGTMGWGFPAAVGAKAANPYIPCVDIAGDGSFGMTENSLATSVEEELPVIVFVLNNQMLGMVAQWQRLFYNRRYSGVKLKGNPDFCKLAEAYGAEGVRPESIQELRTSIRNAINSDITTVIDVMIDPEEDVLPMVPPGMGLKDILMGGG
jgi:acetolactate synthase-1/2/3 large subunit